jgi:hypothetical protein
MDNLIQDWIPSDKFSEGSILQLSSSDAAIYMKNMLKRSETFKQLYDEFTKKGFTFYFERAKVFLYSAEVITKENDALESGISSNILGILPSYILTSAAEPYHEAVSISVHNSGFAIATSVRVDHKPFGITDFTLHEVISKEKKIVSNTLKADDLQTGLKASDLAEKFGDAASLKNASQPKLKEGVHAALHPSDQATMVALTFSQLLRDKFVRPLYPVEGARTLMGQIPLMQQFGNATYTRFQSRFGAPLSINLCTSSSSSSNICTSTSTSSIEL